MTIFAGVEISQLVTAAAALGLAAVAQSFLGFGFALFAMPLLAWTGLEVPLAIAAVTALMLLQAVWLLQRSSKPLRLRANAGNIAFTIAGSAAGVVLLARLWHQRPATVAQLIGLVVVVSVVATQLLRPTSRRK